MSSHETTAKATLCPIAEDDRPPRGDEASLKRRNEDLTPEEDTVAKQAKQARRDEFVQGPTLEAESAQQLWEQDQMRDEPILPYEEYLELVAKIEKYSREDGPQ